MTRRSHRRSPTLRRPAPGSARAAGSVTRLERAGYAARQAALLDMLMRGETYPAGFDVTDADAAGAALRRKRASAVRDSWPALAGALGEDFEIRIDAFLRAHPSSGDGLADGLAFARWLGETQPRDRHGHPALTDDDVRVEILLARAATGRVFVGLRRLGDPGRLILVVRAPWTRPSVVCVPLGRA